MWAAACGLTSGCATASCVDRWATSAGGWMELRLVVDWNTQGRGANRGVVLLAGASPCYYSAYAHGQKRLPAPKWQPANQESGELHQHCVWHQEVGRFLPVVETLAYTGPVAQRQHGYLKYSAHRMQRATMCHNAPIHASAHHTPPPPATHHAGTTRTGVTDCFCCGPRASTTAGVTKNTKACQEPHT